jgi:hypothetical protein
MLPLANNDVHLRNYSLLAAVVLLSTLFKC